MRLIIAMLCFFVASSVIAQSELNNYKYIIIPNVFEELEEANQYQINELAKFLFEKYGFNTHMDYESLPDDLNNNYCLGLKVSLKKDNSIFKTKIKILLKDCKNTVVYESEFGESGEKEFKRSYQEALRLALKPLEKIKYEFSLDSKQAPAQSNNLRPYKKQGDNILNKNISEIEENIKDSESENRMSNTKIESNFSSNTFEIVRTPLGFSLYNSDTNLFLGKGFLSSKKEVYHFMSASEKIGIAYFDNDTTLHVEFIDPQGEVNKRTYNLQ